MKFFAYRDTTVLSLAVKFSKLLLFHVVIRSRDDHDNTNRKQDCSSVVPTFCDSLFYHTNDN